VRRVPIVTVTTPKEDLPQNLTVEESATWMRCHAWTIRKAVREGRLPNVGVGKTILIPKDRLRQMQEPAELEAVL
jgi:excisionase family DNA binding protein